MFHNDSSDQLFSFFFSYQNKYLNRHALFEFYFVQNIVKYRRPWNSPQYSKEEFFCIKLIKFRELFSLYTSHKFTSYRTQHYTTLPTRSYFSEGNSVLFPYSKSEKGWDFDILRMRNPGVWGDLCKCVALRALIRTVARAHALLMYLLVILPFDCALLEGGTPLYQPY